MLSCPNLCLKKDSDGPELAHTVTISPELSSILLVLFPAVRSIKSFFIYVMCHPDTSLDLNSRKKLRVPWRRVCEWAAVSDGGAWLHALHFKCFSAGY